MAVLRLFQERKHSVIFVAFRICIQGAEVTSFILDDGIDVTYSDRNGPNTITFSLHNAFDAFILTKKNMDGTWRGFNENNNQPVYSEVPKRKIYEYKSIYNFEDKDKNKTYNFQPGQIIFNKHDPIRIFIHNPNKELKSVPPSQEEWVPFFTGFIDKFSQQTDYITGASKIQISGSCIKNQLRRMRLSFSPIVEYTEDMVSDVTYNSDITGFFKDLIWGETKSMTQHPLTNKPFVKAIQSLLLGTASDPEIKGTRGRVGFLRMGEEWRGSSPYNLRKWGWAIINDKLERTLYDDGDDHTLEEWYDLLIFGNPNTVERPTSESRFPKFYSSKNVSDIFQETTSHGKESPWAAKVHFLLPPENYELTQILDKETVKSRAKREWTTRWDAILEICTTTDYQWTTTPMGDLVFEIPMYDYMPEEYGFRWSEVFKIDKSAQTDTIEPESGEIVTGLIVGAGIQTFIGSDVDSNMKVDGYFNKVVIKSDILAGKYGINIEAYEAPIGKDAKQGISMQDLQMYGLIEFQKRLAQTDQMSLSFGYHPYLLPNRNIQYGYSNPLDSNNPELPTKPNKIGWISSVTYNIALFKSIKASVDLKYLRNYKLNKLGIPEYSYIFGGSRMPLSFKGDSGYKIGELLDSKEGLPGVQIEHLNLQQENAAKKKNQEDTTQVNELAKGKE